MTRFDPNLVSIIIPCYNQAHFLGEAIESVFKQTCRRFEIIVVDDGSSDNTREVACRVAQVRCVHQENRGLASARNAGLRESRGSYLVFLDADDRLLPEALETGVSSLVAHPDCAFVYGHVKLITEDGLPLPDPPQVAVTRDHYLELLRHNYIWTPGAVMYRRSVFDSITGFNTLVSPSADFELNARIASRFPIHCHDRFVLEYRKHNGNMSSDFAGMLKTSVMAHRLHRKFVKGNKEYERALESGLKAAQKGYGEKLVRQVGSQVRARDWKHAIRGVMAAARYYPKGLVRHTLQRIGL